MQRLAIIDFRTNPSPIADAHRERAVHAAGLRPELHQGQPQQQILQEL